ncbi:MAG TPA: hypothetical protein VF898_08710 [Chloroflexota bacterium]
MIQVDAESDIDTLEARLSKGAELLFDMEQRGETGGEYARWLEYWMRLLEQYEGLQLAS